MFLNGLGDSSTNYTIVLDANGSTSVTALPSMSSTPATSSAFAAVPMWVGQATVSSPVQWNASGQGLPPNILNQLTLQLTNLQSRGPSMSPMPYVIYLGVTQALWNAVFSPPPASTPQPAPVQTLGPLTIAAPTPVASSPVATSPTTPPPTQQIATSINAPAVTEVPVSPGSQATTFVTPLAVNSAPPVADSSASTDSVVQSPPSNVVGAVLLGAAALLIIAKPRRKK